MNSGPKRTVWQHKHLSVETASQSVTEASIKSAAHSQQLIPWQSVHSQNVGVFILTARLEAFSKSCRCLVKIQQGARGIGRFDGRSSARKPVCTAVQEQDVFMRDFLLVAQSPLQKRKCFKMKTR